MADTVLYEVSDGLATITLNRPEAMNALNIETKVALRDAVRSAAADEAVRAVLLTAAGDRAFCVGQDLKEHIGLLAADRETGSGETMSTVREHYNPIVRALAGMRKPVVAAVNGVAAGVGCSAALAADIIVATQSASFLLAFARIGLMPDGGATATVAAAMGRARAMRMALLAEPLAARQAYDAGLVTHVVADDEFEEEVSKIVRRLAGGPPLAFAATKRAINAATLDQLEGALERERTGQTLLLGTDDVAEGMRAFGEKRKPTFRGE